MKVVRLSKSKYLSGLQCHKRLWLETHKPELAPPPPPGQQRIFDQGIRVGELAREQFHNGALIEADYLNIPDAIEQTNEALNNGSGIIFEGCFVNENVLVRPDIILRNDLSGWNIIEVKSSTSVKEENIHDVAVQTWVLRGYGLEVSRMFLKHINRDCVYPNLSNLFRMEDITDQVETVLPGIPKKLSEYLVLLDSSEPNIRIGQHCGNPYDCPFINHCWEWVPEHSIFTIPRLRWSVKERLINEDHIAIDQLPSDFALNDIQKRYLESYQSQKPIIDSIGIREELSNLEYPLHFLDFETDNPAIPRFESMHPYEQFPFQYSCHVAKTSGSISHSEYLHDSETDPRKPLIESLLKAIGDTGTIIAYNAAFEKSVLNKFGQWFPNLSEKLNSILDRLWDLLIIFRKYYIDYRFGGSNSLKNVLSVIVPFMSYADLDIKGGIEAQSEWNAMIQLHDGKEKIKLCEELKEYCRQDTLAMVEIHQRLMALLPESRL